jgi:hypothetical protein
VSRESEFIDPRWLIIAPAMPNANPIFRNHIGKHPPNRIEDSKFLLIHEFS